MEGVGKFVGREGGGGREGVLKAKILEAKYEVKLDFPGGRGVQNKTPFVGVGGEVWIFLELHDTPNPKCALVVPSLLDNKFLGFQKMDPYGPIIPFFSYLVIGNYGVEVVVVEGVGRGGRREWYPSIYH